MLDWELSFFMHFPGITSTHV